MLSYGDHSDDKCDESGQRRRRRKTERTPDSDKTEIQRDIDSQIDDADVHRRFCIAEAEKQIVDQRIGRYKEYAGGIQRENA